MGLGYRSGEITSCLLRKRINDDVDVFETAFIHNRHKYLSEAVIPSNVNLTQ